MDYYVLIVWRGVQPKLHGPYKTLQQRDQKAKKLRNDFGVTASLFPIEVSTGSEISINFYPADFFE